MPASPLPRPWPDDRPPTPSELLEFARITASDEVLPLLGTLLELAGRGRHCMLADHAGAERLAGRASRLQVAHAAARRRAEHWRRIAVELATTHLLRPHPVGRTVEIASGVIWLDGGRNADPAELLDALLADDDVVEVRDFTGRRLRSVQTVDLLAAALEDEPEHEHEFVPVLDGRIDGKPRYSNRCSCGQWQHPVDDHDDQAPVPTRPAGRTS